MSRLQTIENAIFSHIDLFVKPKLTDGAISNANQDLTRIYNVHAIVGQTESIYILGILTQREDTHYYIEDSTFSIRIAFTDLQYADPECFFTENQVLLCKGTFKGEMFYPVSIEQPPIYSHKLRDIHFKVNQGDYFGAYSKLHKDLAAQAVSAASSGMSLA